MKKNVGNHVKGVYKRFLISFLMILILPVAIFFTIFLKDYYKIYQKKIIEQAEGALDGTVKELERELNSLWAISAYNSELNHMQDYAVKKSYAATDVKNTLAAELATHSILNNVYYYTKAVPERVYSSRGSYLWDYFVKNYVGENNETQLHELLELRGKSEWYVWKNAEIESARYRSCLYYAVSIGTGKFWIFSISVDQLQEILDKEYGDTRILNKEGAQIFPFKQNQDAEEKAENYYEISSKSSDGSFSLVRRIDEKELFAELYQWKKYFVITMVVVMLCGSMLAFKLASYNERPVKNLQELCRQKIESIPDHIEGFEAFKFAMKKMENQVSLAEEKRKKNNLLLSLLLGGEPDAQRLSQKLERAGLFRQAKLYCVLAADAEERMITDSSRLELYLNTEFAAGYEIHRVDMEQEQQEVFLVGMSEVGAEKLEAELLRMIDFFEQNLNRRLLFYVGEVCSTPIEIQNSYRSIVTQKRDGLATGEEKLIHCSVEKLKEEKQSYPDEELEELYEALEEADMNKVMVMTEILIDLLKQHEDSRFLYLSIYYDIINAYYRAQSKLILNLESAFLELELLEIKDHADAIQVVRSLEKQYQDCIEGQENRKEKDVLIQVLDYIEENKKSAELSVSTVADFFGMSMSNLSHRFKLYTNQKISDYITEKRFEYAVELLEKTDYRISEIGEMLGYTQTSSFIRKFRQYYNMTPLEYRNRKRE